MTINFSLKPWILWCKGSVRVSPRIFFTSGNIAETMIDREEFQYARVDLTLQRRLKDGPRTGVGRDCRTSQFHAILYFKLQ